MNILNSFIEKKSRFKTVLQTQLFPFEKPAHAAQIQLEVHNCNGIIWNLNFRSYYLL